MQYEEKVKGMLRISVGGHRFILDERDGRLRIRTLFGNVAIEPTHGNSILLSETLTEAAYVAAMSEEEK